MKFTKYHGCGNNFVILNYEDVKSMPLDKLALQICDQSIGIGSDGLIVVKQNPLEMLFYNQDGSRAPMCGNGIRCFAAYCQEQGIVDTNCFEVMTLNGPLLVNRINDEYLVNMGRPQFDMKLLKLNEAVDIENIYIDGLKVASVYMTTIHSVVFVDKLDYHYVEKMGEKICNYPLFKEKTNVNFVEIIDSDNIRVLTYERGVGITKACGSGCCASFVYANKFGYCHNEIFVHLELGTLKIGYNGDDVMMQGPACKIASGEMEEPKC